MGECSKANIWPTREQVNATKPVCFGDYHSTLVVMDVTEVFIEQPSSSVAQKQTFSSYKNYNILKVLIGITPSGVVSFVSKTAWVSSRNFGLGWK